MQVNFYSGRVISLKWMHGVLQIKMAEEANEDVTTMKSFSSLVS